MLTPGSSHRGMGETPPGLWQQGLALGDPTCSLCVAQLRPCYLSLRQWDTALLTIPSGSCTGHLQG